MKAFISHNKLDKETARFLASALIGQGAGVWFDEWDLNPGDSIVGGIEEGVSNSDVFVLLWSSAAASSNWVGTELRAFLRRRVENQNLRIIPIMLDESPLPALVADYLGFRFEETMSLEEIAAQITGEPSDIEIASILQKRILSIMGKKADGGDPLPHLVCEVCGSSNLKRSTTYDEVHDRSYYMVKCADCKWSNLTE